MILNKEWDNKYRQNGNRKNYNCTCIKENNCPCYTPASYESYQKPFVVLPRRQTHSVRLFEH